MINLTDPKNSDKYNPFKNANATMIKDMLINLTDWSEEHYKVNTERENTLPISLSNMVENLATALSAIFPLILDNSILSICEEHYKVNTERYLQRVIQLLLKIDTQLSLLAYTFISSKMKNILFLFVVNKLLTAFLLSITNKRPNNVFITKK